MQIKSMLYFSGGELVTCDIRQVVYKLNNEASSVCFAGNDGFSAIVLRANSNEILEMGFSYLSLDYASGEQLLIVPVEGLLDSSLWQLYAVLAEASLLGAATVLPMRYRVASGFVARWVGQDKTWIDAIAGVNPMMIKQTFINSGV